MTRYATLSLAAALLLAATAAAGCTNTAGGDGERVTITIRYSAFDPAELTVAAGVPITFVLVNEDPIDHEWLIGDEAFHDAHRTGTHAAHGDVPTEVTVPALETRRTTIIFEQPGTLAYICHLPQHEAYGMVGTLTVEG
jgi:plastocyanin